MILFSKIVWYSSLEKSQITTSSNDSSISHSSVKLGDNDQYMPDDGEQTIDVEKFIVHPKFHEGFGDEYWMENDVALLKVRPEMSIWSQFVYG